MKILILSTWILLGSLTILDMGYDYYRYINRPKPVAMELKVDTPVAKFEIKADNDVEWELIEKMLVLVLVTYGGIKVINKKIK